MAQKVRKDKSLSGEFMLKEYERISVLITNENQQAELRVNFFLTIASATAGAIILLSQSNKFSDSMFVGLANGLLVVLLLFATTILNRLNARDIQQNGYRKVLSEIQNYFAQKDPAIEMYLETQRKALATQKYKSKTISYLLGKLRGTLDDIMVLSSALICSGIALVSLSYMGYPQQTVVTWIIIVFIAATIVFYAWYEFSQRLLYTWDARY